MTEYQTHAALVATLETEIVRLRAVNTELRASIQAPIQPDTKLEQAARQALEALCCIGSTLYVSEINKIGAAITALREALEAAPQPAAPTQDPAAWAITYDGRTPHTLWHEGDGPLLDLEINRQGGSAQKMALYTAPQPARQPLTDKRVKVKLGSQYGSDFAGHWFYLHPADEYAEAVLDKRAHGIGGEA